MNTTTKLYGTRYNVIADEDGDLALEGPRGGYYILVPTAKNDNIYTMRSIRSGDKRVKGNVAYVANLGGELIEAGTGDRIIHVPAIVRAEETPEDTEVLSDDEMAALHAQGVEIETEDNTLTTEGRKLAADLEAHLAASWALSETNTQTRQWVTAGLDHDTAQHMATADVISRDKRAVLALALYTVAGRVPDLDGRIK